MKKLLLLLMCITLLTLSGQAAEDKETPQQEQNTNSAENPDLLYWDNCKSALKELSRIPANSEEDFLSFVIYRFAPEDLMLTPKTAKDNKLFAAQVKYRFPELAAKAEYIFNNPKTKESCDGENTTAEEDSQSDGFNLLNCYAAAECSAHLNKKYSVIKDYIDNLAAPYYNKERKTFKRQFGGDYTGSIKFCSKKEDCSCPAVGDVVYVKDYTLQHTRQYKKGFLAENDVMDYAPIFIKGSVPELYYNRITVPVFLQSMGKDTFTVDKGMRIKACSYKLLDYDKVNQMLNGFSFYPVLVPPASAELCAVSANWPGADCGE